MHRRVIFKVNMANAGCVFSCSWGEKERERAQALHRLLWQSYSRPTNSFYGNTNLVLATGIQQRDYFYLNNETLRDSPENVLAMVTQLIENLLKVELELNPKRCEWTILNHTKEEKIQTFGRFKELLPKLKLVPAAKSFLLRAPLSEEDISVAIREKRENLE